MIHSKFNQRHVYESIEPIYDSETGAFSGDVMTVRTTRNGAIVAIHMKFRDLVATTKESQERLDQIKDPKGERG